MTSKEVAIMIGLPRAVILKLVNDHPQLRPPIAGRSGYQWNDVEIEALRRHIAKVKRSKTIIAFYLFVLPPLTQDFVF